MLIASVLLQPGKTDAGALFTSNVSSTAFAPRGTASVLAKFTIGAAIVFMLSALMISLPVLSGDRSVLSSNPEETIESTETAQPASAQPPQGEPAAETVPPDGNSNAAANSNTMAVPLQDNPPQ